MQEVMGSIPISSTILLLSFSTECAVELPICTPVDQAEAAEAEAEEQAVAEAAVGGHRGDSRAPHEREGRCSRRVEPVLLNRAQCLRCGLTCVRGCMRECDKVWYTRFGTI